MVMKSSNINIKCFKSYKNGQFVISFQYNVKNEKDNGNDNCNTNQESNETYLDTTDVEAAIVLILKENKEFETQQRRWFDISKNIAKIIPET